MTICNIISNNKLIFHFEDWNIFFIIQYKVQILYNRSRIQIFSLTRWLVLTNHVLAPIMAVMTKQTAICRARNVQSEEVYGKKQKAETYDESMCVTRWLFCFFFFVLLPFIFSHNDSVYKLKARLVVMENPNKWR